jgi:hypothetical protein
MGEKTKEGLFSREGNKKLFWNFIKWSAIAVGALAVINHIALA